MPQNDEFLLTLRNANPIEEVMGSYVKLIKRGRNYVCNCPFHSEKTPSCTVFLDRDPHFYCFGCGAGGDVITFIMKIENLDFREAVKLLAQRAGLEMPEYSSKNSGLAKLRTRIYEMNRIAANFYYKNLLKGPDKSGLKYFAERKLTPQTVKKYGLGFAPNAWDELARLLLSKGYTEDEMIQGWLCGRNRNGKLFDMFRNRVMFPIIDLRGNVIGFGGRVLDDSKPKYLNTGATPVFDKGNNLFSMNFAKDADVKRLILCEGYMDVIAVNQAGFENVVATLGTAITPEQARLMSHYADEVIIAYDSDSAGQKATQKAINHFADVGLRTRILKMEGAKDPDEFIKKFGANRFRILIDNSGDANLFMLDRCEEGLDLDTEMGRVELLRRVAGVLAGIENPLEREVYISRSAKKCEIPADVLKDHIDGLLKKNVRTQKKSEWKNIQAQISRPKDLTDPQEAKHRRESRAEEMIISYLLARPEEAKRLSKEAPPEIFATQFHKKVYAALLTGMTTSPSFTMSVLGEFFTPEEMGRISGISAKMNGREISSAAVADCIALLQQKKLSALPENGEYSEEDLRKLFDSKKG
ncbi:MAG: DNA primase [Ruminococcus sp.]|nr:DNA primase [Ruminococcus sp.]